ncbi:hypothetical protein CRG98_033462 [Punica granatum]|uniref:Uncharacterized protein n=1 Tax=Punica granatum TaxID=22663 RepID=A0A2I0IQ72_PUNGR|nr:hypothetical protein CRG98_033462 [Punica granatum]
MVMSIMKLMVSGVRDGGERQVMEVGGVMGVERGQRMKMVIAMEPEERKEEDEDEGRGRDESLMVPVMEMVMMKVAEEEEQGMRKKRGRVEGKKKMGCQWDGYTWQ